MKKSALFWLLCSESCLLGASALAEKSPADSRPDTWVATDAAGGPDRPNVVFIVVDDLGWKDTGCYGSSFYRTPHVDELAETGVRFTEAYSANPLCSATRASILSGRYPIRTGLTGAAGHLAGKLKHEERHTYLAEARAAPPSEINYLSPDFYTLGEAMKDAGYATAFLGKWHMGHEPYTPENNGFDYVVGGRHHPGPPGINPHRMFYPPFDNTGTLPQDVPPDTHIDDYLGDQAVKYITEHADEPFFMCFWLYDVHAPYQSKPHLVEKWKKRVDPDNPQRCPTMGAMIEVMDNNVGRVLDALENNGIDDRTIVIFTSDNGGTMYMEADGTTPTNNEPLRSGKGNNYEGGVRIPLIIRWPGRTKPGSVNDSVVSTVDHYPSILEMTGQKLRPDEHKDGVSYVDALDGNPFDRGPTICGFEHFLLATMNIPNVSVRDGDWKLYRFWFDRTTPLASGGTKLEHRYELYNLSEDLGETRNVADAFPERVKAMDEIITRYYNENDILRPHTNQAYNGRTIGVWAANDRGTARAVEGALCLHSDQDQFAAETRVIANMNAGAVIEFEARSETETHLSVQWTSSAQPTYKQPQLARVNLSKTWSKHRVAMPFAGGIKKIRFVLRDAGWQASVRNVKVYTAEGTLMTAYEFY